MRYMGELRPETGRKVRKALLPAILVLVCSAACRGPAPSGLDGFEDVKQAVLRPDGLYNVVCFDGRFEIGVSADDLVGGQVCTGDSSGGEDPRPPASFLEFCQDASAKAGARQTVAAVLAEFDARSCQEASDFLLSEESLKLSGTGLTDLTPLAGAVQLRYLEIDGNQISDLRPLRFMTGLVYLNARQNQISHLDGLENAGGLVRLYLDDNLLTDAGPLRGMPDLAELPLARNRFASVESLTSLPALYELNLSGNQLRDARGLEAHPGLRSLDLSENQLTGVAPLAGLTVLKNLNLARNSINDLLPVAGLTELLYLYIDSNPVRDLSPLSEMQKLVFLSAAELPLGTEVARTPANCPVDAGVAAPLRNWCLLR